MLTRISTILVLPRPPPPSLKRQYHPHLRTPCSFLDLPQSSFPGGFVQIVLLVVTLVNHQNSYGMEAQGYGLAWALGGQLGELLASL